MILIWGTKSLSIRPRCIGAERPRTQMPIYQLSIYSTEQFSKNSFHLMVCILSAAVISLLPAVLQCTSGYSEGLPTQNLKNYGHCEFF